MDFYHYSYIYRRRNGSVGLQPHPGYLINAWVLLSQGGMSPPVTCVAALSESDDQRLTRQT